MKKIRLNRADLMSVLLCVFLIIPGVSIYDRLPDRVAINFGINGQPQQYSSKDFAVFGIPLITSAMQLMLCLITNLFNKTDTKDLINRAIRFYNPAIYYFAYVSLLLHALGQMKDPTSVIFTIMAVVFVVMGNYMPKMRRNMFLGIRTPHTLTDQDVWDKTQRFTGIITIICGIAMLPFALMKKGIVVLILVMLKMIATFIYSEIVYHSEKEKVKVNE